MTVAFLIWQGPWGKGGASLSSAVWCNRWAISWTLWCRDLPGLGDWSDTGKPPKTLLCLLYRKIMWMCFFRICLGILHWKMTGIFDESFLVSISHKTKHEKSSNNSEQNSGQNPGQNLENSGSFRSATLLTPQKEQLPIMLARVLSKIGVLRSACEGAFPAISLHRHLRRHPRTPLSTPTLESIPRAFPEGPKTGTFLPHTSPGGQFLG